MLYDIYKEETRASGKKADALSPHFLLYVAVIFTADRMRDHSSM